MRSQPARTRYRKASRASSNRGPPSQSAYYSVRTLAAVAEPPLVVYNAVLKLRAGFSAIVAAPVRFETVIGTRSRPAPSHRNEQTTNFSS